MRLSKRSRKQRPSPETSLPRRSRSPRAASYRSPKKVSTLSYRSRLLVTRLPVFPPGYADATRDSQEEENETDDDDSITFAPKTVDVTTRRQDFRGATFLTVAGGVFVLGGVAFYLRRRRYSAGRYHKVSA